MTKTRQPDEPCEPSEASSAGDDDRKKGNDKDKKRDSKKKTRRRIPTMVTPPTQMDRNIAYLRKPDVE